MERSGRDLNAGDRHQEKTDEQLIEMWLDGKSEHTQEYYDRTARDLLGHVGKPIRQIDEADLQRWTRTLTDYAESTQTTKINAARSLFSFAEDIGYIQYKVGKMLKLPKTKDQLHERLLTPALVQRMIGMSNTARKRPVLRTLYMTGARVTELTRLTWGDLSERSGAAQLTIFGKGSKSRTIAIPDALAEDLEEVGRSLKTTNAIESLNSLVEEYIGNVKRWHHSKQRARWLALGLIEAEERMQRIAGYEELPQLRAALQDELDITDEDTESEEEPLSEEEKSTNDW